MPAITVLRALSRAFRTRHATILENNTVQTTGSAGESIAFGDNYPASFRKWRVGSDFVARSASAMAHDGT